MLKQGTFNKLHYDHNVPLHTQFYLRLLLYQKKKLLNRIYISSTGFMKLRKQTTISTMNDSIIQSQLLSAI